METLREISHDYQALLYEALNEEEIQKETLDKLKYTDSKFDEKIGNMAYIIQELKTKCRIVNEEIDRLCDRIFKWHKNIKRIQEYMLVEMETVGKTKVDTEFYTVGIRKSETTQVDNEFLKEAQEKHLDRLVRVIPERLEPDKQAIKDYINSGHELQHARIIEKQNLNIR